MNRGFLKYVFILSLIFIIIFSLKTEPILSDEIDWEIIEEESQKKIENEDKSKTIIISRFELAIAQANLGKVEESYEQIQILGEKDEEKTRNIIENRLSSIPEEQEIMRLNYLGFLALIDKKYEDSIKHYNALIELEPENANIYNYLAASHIELEELDKASSILDQALEIEDNSYSHVLYSIVHKERGNYIKALNSLNKSGKLFQFIDEIF
ncbi:MAG: tetratricopeptide repeat protein [bacterium]